MKRADAQHLLDVLEPGHRVSVTEGRDRSGRVVYAVARWRGECAFRVDAAQALRALVRAAYRARGLDFAEPETPATEATTAAQRPLPGVR